MPEKQQRYLNARAKAELLAEFRERRQEAIPNGNVGGKGYPDPGILPFCDWLNSFDGVCTLQSCEGHRERMGHVATSGVLWIWFDKKLAEEFRSRAFEIVTPPIERVSQVYSGSMEYVEVVFNGTESGQLQESLAILGSFIESLANNKS